MKYENQINQIMPIPEGLGEKYLPANHQPSALRQASRIREGEIVMKKNHENISFLNKLKTSINETERRIGLKFRQLLNQAVVLILLTILLLSNYALAQSSSKTGLTPGAPSGTYKLDNLDNVNLFNGNLNFDLPLLSNGGRGETQNQISVVIDGQWDMNEIHPDDVWTIHNYSFKSQNGLALVGKITFEMPFENDGTCYEDSGTMGASPRQSFKGVMTYVAPDGTEQILRDQVIYAHPKDFCGDALNIGNTFKSGSDASITFVTDTNFCIGNTTLISGCIDDPTGYLYFKNGTKSRVVSGQIIWTEDRNGNKIEYTYETNAYKRLIKVTDSLNREINIAYDVNEGTPYGLCNKITCKGFNGQDRVIRISYDDNIANVLRTTQSYDSSTPLGTIETDDPSDNILPTGGPGGRFTTAVWLPDGRSYQFKYNILGQLARVVLPTGGAFEYDFEDVPRMPLPAGYIGTYPNTLSMTNRVTEKRVYDGNGALVNKTKFSIPTSYTSGVTSYPRDFIVRDVEQLDANGNRLSKSRHYLFGKPDDQFSFLVPWWYEKEFRTETFDLDGTTLLAVNEKDWRQRIPAWCTNNPFLSNFAMCLTNPAETAPADNPLMVEEKDTLADVNLVSKTSSINPSTGDLAFDSYGNPTDSWQYDFGSGSPGAFLRRSHTDYVTNTNYAANHILGLPSQSWVSSDAAGNNKVSLSQMEYDNYANDTNHASLVDRSNVTGHDSSLSSGNPWRGNVTGATSYADAANQTGAITAYSQYDILGNVVKTIDAKGNASTISYSDNFGSPDGEAETNSAPSQLNGNSTFALATSATNPAGFTTHAQYDYFTGAGVDAEDINGVVSSNFYNDALDRPTQSIAANNVSGLKQQTTIAYDDTNHKVTSTSDLFSYGDNSAKAESYYDGLGRTTESRSYETGGGYVAVDTEYDALGRVKRVTNPYRPLQSESQLWTTSTYDALGRVTTVTGPDNTQVQTSYAGNAVTATDQAGKQRRSMTNAIGELTRVDEPDDSGNLGTVASPNQPTSYNYDTVGKMVKVTQGVQNRYFKYDDLGRLLRVRQPEEGTNSSLSLSDAITGNNDWSAGFTYDANGNMLTATDTKGTVITNTYDNLNRNLTRSYSDGTPTVTNTYDDAGVQYSKGHLTKTSNAVSTSQILSLDNLGRVLSSRQTTDGNNYDSSYTYNLSGALVEETYPSGRKVKDSFQSDGKLSKIETQASGGSYATRADNFAYAAHGAISQLKFGNSKWENAQFNSRLQVTQLGLGTSATDQSLWKLNYDFGTTDNNGNVKGQTTTVPGINPLVQTFTYDALDRLKSATETQNSTQTWKQTFVYDRYGNRNFDAANTTTLGSCTTAVCNPTVDTNTNRFTTSQGYTYDLSGNIISDPDGKQYTFNGDNKQTEVKDAGNNTIGTYYYDGDGKRIKKVTNAETTTFVYSGGKLVAEYQLTNSTPTTPTTQYLTTDMLESPRVITDGSGNVVSRRDFMPFGEEISGLGNRSSSIGYNPDTIRQKFTGYEKDDETGLDFAEARYYNSQNGRFTAVDPLLASGKSANPQTFNRYAYTLGNPLILVDKSGMQTSADKGEVITGSNAFSLDKAWVDTGRITYAMYEYINGLLDSGYEPSSPVIQGLLLDKPEVNNAVQIANDRVKPAAEFVRDYEPTGSLRAWEAGRDMDLDIKGSTPRFGFEMGMMGVNMLTMASGGGTERQGLSFLGKDLVEAEEEKEGYNAVIGIVNHNEVLFEFAQKKNAITYFDMFGRGAAFTESRFSRFINGANEIHINFGNGFDMKRYINWQRRGAPDEFEMITNFEIDQVLSTPKLKPRIRIDIHPAGTMKY